jgi:hypothetical protein
MIRGFPNGKTRHREAVSLYAEYIGIVEPTRGTETSKYPEEEKTIVIPQVVASERGPAQTDRLTGLSGL